MENSLMSSSESASNPFSQRELDRLAEQDSEFKAALAVVNRIREAEKRAYEAKKRVHEAEKRVHEAEKRVHEAKERDDAAEEELRQREYELKVSRLVQRHQPKLARSTVPITMTERCTSLGPIQDGHEAERPLPIPDASVHKDPWDDIYWDRLGKDIKSKNVESALLTEPRSTEHRARSMQIDKHQSESRTMVEESAGGLRPESAPYLIPQVANRGTDSPSRSFHLDQGAGGPPERSSVAGRRLDTRGRISPTSPWHNARTNTRKPLFAAEKWNESNRKRIAEGVEKRDWPK